MKARNTFSRILHQLGHSCSGFENYFAKVQSGNCHDCPDCRCEGGPSLEEAKRDFRAMHQSPPLLFV